MATDPFLTKKSVVGLAERVLLTPPPHTYLIFSNDSLESGLFVITECGFNSNVVTDPTILWTTEDYKWKPVICKLPNGLHYIGVINPGFILFSPTEYLEYDPDASTAGELSWIPSWNY